MSVKIIQVTDGGAEEFDSVEAWVKYFIHSGHPIGIGLQSAMLKMIDTMPSGTVAMYGGGWVLKDVEEIKFDEN